MALPLITAIAGERACRPVAYRLLVFLVAVMMAGPTLAEDQDEAFSATVKVDATADTAAAARELARIDGQRRALTAVIDRLSGSSEATKLPKLDDKAITNMVDSFEVANERMSAVRYLAEYTFHFRPSKVRRLVRVTDSPSAESDKSSAESAGKTATEGASGPIVVLPVYKDGARLVLWDDPNGWRAAWEQRSPAASGPIRVTLPLGDANDLAAIDAEKAQSGKSDALSAIAQRNGGSETVVALATARRQGDRIAGLDVSVKRYRSGRLVDSQGKSVGADPGESEADLLRRTANAVATDIEAMKIGGPRSDQQASLSISVPITSLGEWLQVRNRLASVPSIRKVDLLSLSRQEARIQIKYLGNPDALKSSLAEVNLDLAGGDPLWRIQASGATGSR
jgi:uncharacterized protein DUF2066